MHSSQSLYLNDIKNTQINSKDIFSWDCLFLWFHYFFIYQKVFYSNDRTLSETTLRRKLKNILFFDVVQFFTWFIVTICLILKRYFLVFQCFFILIYFNLLNIEVCKSSSSVNVEDKFDFTETINQNLALLFLFFGEYGSHRNFLSRSIKRYFYDKFLTKLSLIKENLVTDNL